MAVRRPEHLDDLAQYREEHPGDSTGYESLWNKYNYIENRDQKLASVSARYKTAHGRFLHAKTKAKQRNIPFLLSEEYFTKWFESLDLYCVYCGDMVVPFGGKEYGKRTMSIDRIDNNKGYEQGNIACCCQRCNEVKNDFFTTREMEIIGPLVRSRRLEIEALSQASVTANSAASPSPMHSSPTT